ncbi:MAG: methionine synthase [Prevotella sp.]|nr:methionine synthase [Prevotella sp.]
MFEKRLSLENLHIRPEEVYRQMGYGKETPDERTVAEVKRLFASAMQIAVPRYCYMVMEGTLEKDLLLMGEREFHLGSIIGRQLAGATHFAVFVATAGTEFEEWRKRDDLLESFIADALGSVVAERCADEMEKALQTSIDKLGWKRTNRFSPGYCEWATAEQRKLVPLLGNPNPCGVLLTESALMWPVKSVSGIVGLGENVSYHDYSCQLCQLTHCFRRR